MKETPVNYTEEAAEGEPAAQFVTELIEKMGIGGKVLAAREEDAIRLRIDSDTFRVLLNGENVLDKQSGDWLMLSRDLLYLDIESAIGNGLSGNLIYTERYL